MLWPNLLFYEVLAWNLKIKNWSARVGLRRRQTAATDTHRRLIQPCVKHAVFGTVIAA